ncbi:MAG: AraC family transcriptional regulator [Lachnospiraceae bacterium]|nr:AraC family transcriptional regulator [Lachnospiraceae bacterium]
MNYEELDEYLREPTEDEKSHMPLAHAIADYSTLRQVHIHGISTPLLTKREFSDFSTESILMVAKHPRYLEIPLHVHEWIEMTYIYSGECTQQIDDNLYHLQKGQLCMIDTGTPHAIHTCSEDDILINILINKEYFTTNFLSRFSSRSLLSSFIVNAISEKTNNDNYIIFHSEKSRHLLVLIRELMCEYFSPSLNSADVLDAYMALIFLELIRIQENEMLETNVTEKGLSLLSVLHYVENNDKEATLQKAAVYFGMNPSYLSTLLKKKFGYTFGELLRKIRMNHAKRLLRSTTMSVTEIAQTVGYENISYFYQKFRLETGLNPGEYRDNL